jgi:hypothetical protein
MAVLPAGCDKRRCAELYLTKEAMSALGHFRTLRHVCAMSAYHSKADIRKRRRHVRKGPLPDKVHRSKMAHLAFEVL